MLGFGVLIARVTLAPDNISLRKLGSIVSGVGLLLLLFSGFGLFAKVCGNQFYGWVIVKMVIWVIFGALTVVINRCPKYSMVLFRLTIVLAATAAFMAISKPMF